MKNESMEHVPKMQAVLHWEQKIGFDKRTMKEARRRLLKTFVRSILYMEENMENGQRWKENIRSV